MFAIRILISPSRLESVCGHKDEAPRSSSQILGEVVSVREGPKASLERRAPKSLRKNQQKIVRGGPTRPQNRRSSERNREKRCRKKFARAGLERMVRKLPKESCEEDAAALSAFGSLAPMGFWTLPGISAFFPASTSARRCPSSAERLALSASRFPGATVRSNPYPHSRKLGKT